MSTSSTLQDVYLSFQKWAEDTLRAKYEEFIAEDRATANRRIKEYAGGEFLDFAKGEWSFHDFHYYVADHRNSPLETFVVGTVLRPDELHQEIEFTLRDLEADS